jgi:hypothetical protein
MEATFPLEDDRNRDKRSDAPQASGSRVSSLSLLLVEHCERRDRNGYKGGDRRAVVRRLLCHEPSSGGLLLLLQDAVARHREPVPAPPPNAERGSDDRSARKQQPAASVPGVAKPK